MLRQPRIAAHSQESSPPQRKRWWIAPCASDGEEEQARSQPTMRDIPAAAGVQADDSTEH
jgi:hypothetical protein